MNFPDLTDTGLVAAGQLGTALALAVHLLYLRPRAARRDLVLDARLIQDELELAERAGHVTGAEYVAVQQLLQRVGQNPRSAQLVLTRIPWLRQDVVTGTPQPDVEYLTGALDRLGDAGERYLRVAWPRAGALVGLPVETVRAEPRTAPAGLAGPATLPVAPEDEWDEPDDEWDDADGEWASEIDLSEADPVGADRADRADGADRADRAAGDLDLAGFRSELESSEIHDVEIHDLGDAAGMDDEDDDEDIDELDLRQEPALRRRVGDRVPVVDPTPSWIDLVTAEGPPRRLPGQRAATTRRSDGPDRPERSDRTARLDRPGRAATGPEGTSRLDRTDRPHRLDRLDRLDRSGGPDRSGRPDRSDRSDRSASAARPFRPARPLPRPSSSDGGPPA
jgi:hypothetical protein